MAPKKIKIEAMIAAPIERVWSAWSKPEHIVHWNFASPDWCCPRAVNDLRVGGKYNARMEAKDGSFGFDFEAVYTEVALHKKIVYTMEDGREAATEFEKVGDKVKVTTAFDAEKENPEDMQKDGWQAILNNFKQYVEDL